MVVGGPERVPRDRVPRREDHKVSRGGARGRAGEAPGSGGGGQDREDGRVRVVERDGVHRAELGEVVLVGGVVAVPGLFFVCVWFFSRWERVLGGVGGESKKRERERERERERKSEPFFVFLSLFLLPSPCPKKKAKKKAETRDPHHDVEGRKGLAGREELASKLVDDGEGGRRRRKRRRRALFPGALGRFLASAAAVAVVVGVCVVALCASFSSLHFPLSSSFFVFSFVAFVLVPSLGRQKVPRSGQAVGPDGAQLGEDKVRPEDLQDVPSRPRRLRFLLSSALGLLVLLQRDGKADPGGDDGDLPRAHRHPPHLRPDPQRPQLRDDEHVPVGVAQTGALHRGVGGVDVDGVAAPRQRRPGPAERRQAADKVDGRVVGARDSKGPPPDLVRGQHRPASPSAAAAARGPAAREARAEVLGAELERVEGLVGHRGPGPVEPGAALGGARGGEGGPGDLLGVEAKGADLMV